MEKVFDMSDTKGNELNRVLGDGDERAGLVGCCDLREMRPIMQVVILCASDVW